MASHDGSVDHDLERLRGELDLDQEELHNDQHQPDLNETSGSQIAQTKRVLTSCDTLRKCQFGYLTQHQKRVLKDEEHWKALPSRFTSRNDLHTRADKSRKNKQGKAIACCGHLCIHGELHWFCHKCQVFSGFKPCCTSMDRSLQCPTGQQMDLDVIKTRANQIAKIQRDKQLGIVPGWRKYKVDNTIESDDVNAGASTSNNNNDTSTAMDTHENNNNNQLENESADEDDVRATQVRMGERKPLPTSTDCLPVIDRGDAGSFKDVMSELKDLGVPCVPLAPSADVIHLGVPLDETWLEMIDLRLQELRTHWMTENSDVDSIPPSEILQVDAAPFDVEECALKIAPLQFPAVERLGVAPRAFSGNSVVRLTQKDLAAWEEQLKYALHCLSFAKTLHAVAVDVHHRELEERNAQNEQNGVSSPKLRRSQRRKLDTGCDTPTVEVYPLVHVDEAATTAINNSAKVLVNCLVDVVVARRRGIVVKGTQRAELVAILTRSITNTAALA